MSNKSRLLDNIVSLALVQGTNAIVPLVTLPYLVKVLGPEGYGVLVLAQTVVQYFVILTDYGFNLSATKAISVSRDDPSLLSQVFSSVMLIKILLLILGVVILIGLLFLVRPFGLHWPVYLMCYIAVLGNIMFPYWFFQGLEQVRWISIVSVLVRLAMVVALIVFVKQPSDLLIAAILQAINGVVSGSIALILLRYWYPKIRWVWPQLNQLRVTIQEGWSVFITTLSFTAYTSYSVLLLGLFFGNAASGYYGAGERVVRAIAQGLFQPVHQAMFPHVSLLAQKSRKEVVIFNQKVLLILVPLLGVLAIILVLFSNRIVHILFDARYQSAAMIIATISLLPLFTATSGVLGANTMLALGYSREFGQTFVLVAIVGLPITILLVYLFHQVGGAIAAISIEVMVTTILWIRLKRLGVFA